MPYDVAKIRQQLKKSMAGKFNDPDEFKPRKAESERDAIKYRFYVLPPLQAGDVLKIGQVQKSMEQFFVVHANHWISDKPHPCPRVWDNATECDICNFGFELLKDQKDEDARRKIIKTWMPTTYYMVNIFFTNSKINPEDLRGRVMFYNAPKTCFDHWIAALMRDDAGDEEEPQAYGVFFDENSAFLYQLEVLKQGKQNSYKTSKFIVPGDKKQPLARPMIVDAEGKPITDSIKKLLRLRHNLWSKIEVPDPAKIQKVFLMMTAGDDDADHADAGFDEDETKVTEPKAEKSKTEQKAEKPKESKAEKSKTEQKAEKPKESKADPDDDAIANVPIDDDEPSTKQSSAKSTSLDDEGTVDTVDVDADSDSSGNSDIESLLDQLEDNEE